jgi:lysyl-tRNA synthetase class 2
MDDGNNEQMLEAVALETNGSTKVVADGKEIDFKAPYRRLTMHDAIKEYTVTISRVWMRKR